MSETARDSRAAPEEGPMIDLVTRTRRAEAKPRDSSWQDIPLEVVMCAAAIFLAAGLKLAGVMP